MDKASTNFSQPVPAPEGILDLRGMNLFPARDSSARVSGAEDFERFLKPFDPRANLEHVPSGDRLLSIRVTPEEMAELRARFAEAQQAGETLTESPESPASVAHRQIGADDDIIQRMLELAIGSTGIDSDNCSIIDLTPDERGSAYECISAYFCDYPPGPLRMLETTANNMPPLEVSCRASICIPVAAHEEGRNIYRTLKSFTNQTVQAETFEIVLFLNHPEVNTQGELISPDSTLAEVARFQRDYPHIRVRAVYAALKSEDAKIGFIRKFLNDLVVMRQFMRGSEAPELVLIRVDADTHGVKPEFLSNYYRLFDKHPDVDAFKGRLDWDWPNYLRDPALVFGTRLFLGLDSYIGSIKGDIGGGGANFAIRASRYADIGGYSSGSDMAEDVQLGSALKDIRFGAKNHIAIQDAGARSRLWTDNRRGLAALKKGHAPVCQWHNSDTDFGAINPDIRRAAPAAGASSYEELLFDPEFSNRVAVLIQQTLDFYTTPVDPLRQEYVKNVLPKFGVEASLDEQGKISLGDISGLIGWLKSFGDYAAGYWTEKLGFEGI